MIRVRVVEVDRALHEPEAERAGVEVHRRLRLARDGRDVMQPAGADAHRSLRRSSHRGNAERWRNATAKGSGRGGEGLGAQRRGAGPTMRARPKCSRFAAKARPRALVSRLTRMSIGADSRRGAPEAGHRARRARRGGEALVPHRLGGEEAARDVRGHRLLAAAVVAEVEDDRARVGELAEGGADGAPRGAPPLEGGQLEVAGAAAQPPDAGDPVAPSRCGSGWRGRHWRGGAGRWFAWRAPRDGAAGAALIGWDTRAPRMVSSPSPPAL